jgi:hypothetical protein
MDQDQIVAIVNSSGVPYTPGTRQKQKNQVRFFGLDTTHSLNLGYEGGDFVADFVFKHEDRDVNIRRSKAFIEAWTGELRKDKTVFVRITMPCFREAQLVQTIQAYWALSL